MTSVLILAGLPAPRSRPAGSRFLTRGTEVAAYETVLKERMLTSEFASVEQVITAHDGPAYHEALRALGDGADREIRIVEGLE